MNASILNFILIVLLFFAGLSSFFGKNLPKAIWLISLISAGLSGFVLGMILAPFPDSLLLGLFASAGAILLVLILRIPRRNQPR
jgi:hypothetical protein